MTADAAVEMDVSSGGDDGAGEQAGIDVVTADVSRLQIARAVSGGEQVLRAEVLGRPRKLAGQGERQKRA